MRHRLSRRQLGRTASHRKSLINNQVTDLLRHDRIVTTEAKAKEVRPIAERVITLGKRGDGNARRRAGAVITDSAVVRRLFDEVAPRFQDRSGGYTRIVKLGPRLGDGANMAQLELVEGAVADRIMESAAVDDAEVTSGDDAATAAAANETAVAEAGASADEPESTDDAAEVEEESSADAAPAEEESTDDASAEDAPADEKKEDA